MKHRLECGRDDTFKIIQVSDLQEAYFSSPVVREFLYDLAEKERPDLFILTGDNVSSNEADWKIGSISKHWVKTGIGGYMRVFDRIYDDFGIPVTMVYGNHDCEAPFTSRAEQFAVYQSHRSFIGFLTGADKGACDDLGECLGTHNLLVYGSSGKPAFHLWMFDSGHGECGVQKPQLNWFRRVNEETGKLPSVAFQHIVVPEIYDFLTQTDENDSNSFRRVFADGNGAEYTKYISRDLPAGVKGAMREAPCAPKYNDGQYDALSGTGNVLALFCGHEHKNTFELRRENAMDLINSPGSSFGQYGDLDLRGVRVITLDEKDPGAYETHLVTYQNFYSGNHLRGARMRLYQRRRNLAYAADILFFHPLLWLLGLPTGRPAGK